METPDNPSPASVSRGLITTPLALLGQILAMLMTALLLRLLAEWLGAVFFWPQQGAEHAHQMMNQELAWFSDNIVRSILVADPAGVAEQALTQVYRWVFVDTGVIAWGERVSYRFLANTADWHNGLDTIIQATMYTMLTFVLRLFLLLLTLPLFMLTITVGIIDGLVRRDIRRFGSGYESAFIYHHARQAVRPVLFVPWFIWLALPLSIHPGIILWPGAVLSGLVVSVAVGSFKKFL